MHLWHIPYLSSVIGIFAALYGLIVSIRFLQKNFWRLMRKNWLSLLVPVFVLSLLFYTKLAYLQAGSSDGDEARSFLFTSALASNDLKPAYPLDLSIPVAYPYFSFETSAFLYHAARGYSFPSVALFATTLVTVGLFFYVLYLISSLVFHEKEHRRSYVLTTVFLTFSGVAGLKHWVTLPSFVRYQIQPMTLYFHSGYHYLWGVCLGILGIVLLAQALRGRTWHLWYTAILLLFLSFGYAGISAAWIGLGGMIVFLHYFLADWKRMLLPLLRRVPVSIATACIALLPQLFSLLPRFDASFSFSFPHFWFPVDSQLFLVMTSPLEFSFWRVSIVAPTILLTNIGIFLVVALGFSVVSVTQWFTRRHEEWLRLLPVSICIVVAIALMTFTTTVKTDWFSRGFLVPTILCSFIAAKLFGPFFRRWWLAAPILLLILIQALSFWEENVRYHFSLPPKHLTAMQEINDTYDLGTIFYEKEFILGNDIFRAGRASISVPPAAFASYLPHPDVLARIGIQRGFGPCMRSAYGMNTPTNHYVDTRGGTWIEKTCPP